MKTNNMNQIWEKTDLKKETGLSSEQDDPMMSQANENLEDGERIRGVLG